MYGETKETQKDPLIGTGGLQVHLNARPPRYGPKMIPLACKFQ